VHSAREEDLSARVLPDGATSLVFQRDGSVLRSADGHWRPWAPACVSGPRTGPFDFTLSAAGQIFIVQLLPAGAMQALGVPLSSLVDRFEQTESGAGPDADLHLQDRGRNAGHQRSWRVEPPHRAGQGLRRRLHADEHRANGAVGAVDGAVRRGQSVLVSLLDA